MIDECAVKRCIGCVMQHQRLIVILQCPQRLAPRIDSPLGIGVSVGLVKFFRRSLVVLG